MSSSDPSLIAILIKLICVAASVVIGAIMAMESQHNGVQRRDLLLLAVRMGSPKSAIKHTSAFLLNMIFLWMLQFAVLTLLAVMVGIELESMLKSTPYILIVSLASMALPSLVIVGKPASTRRPSGTL